MNLNEEKNQEVTDVDFITENTPLIEKEEQVIQKKQSKDKIIDVWVNNYVTNLESGRLSLENSRPLMFLINNYFYNKVPTILIGAGPSLDDNINELKEYQNNALILCADVAIIKVLKEGIKPDFVVSLDPSELISECWDAVDTSDLNLICSTTANPSTIDKWKGKIFFYNQIDFRGTPKGESLKKLIYPTRRYGNVPNNYFVGATLLQMAQLFKPSKVLLAGYDFAYKNDKIYCEGLLENRYKDEELRKQRIQTILDASIKEGEIQTSNLMLIYRNVCERLITGLKLDVTNSTEGGILSCRNMKLKDSLKMFCPNTIVKKDVFSIPKRKRHKK